MAKKVDLLHPLVELYFLPEFAHCVELVLVLLVVANSPQRHSQVLLLLSALVLHDVEGIRQISTVHVAKLFV